MSNEIVELDLGKAKCWNWYRNHIKSKIILKFIRYRYSICLVEKT